MTKLKKKPRWPFILCLIQIPADELVEALFMVTEDLFLKLKTLLLNSSVLVQIRVSKACYLDVNSAAVRLSKSVTATQFPYSANLHALPLISMQC